MTTATSQIPVRVPSPVRCDRCVGRVCEAVRSLPGVSSAECDVRTSMLTVTHDSAVVSRLELQHEVERLGFEAPQGVEHEAYRVTGLD